MEFDSLTALIGAIVAVLAAASILMRQQNKAAEGERAAREALNDELRSDVKQLEATVTELQQTVQQLRAEATEKDTQIAALQKQLATVIEQLNALQRQLEVERSARANGEEKNKQLVAEIKQLEASKNEMRAECERLRAERDILQRVLSDKVKLANQMTENKPKEGKAE